MIKITCISDTHGQHGEVKLDGGDILIHAGDIAATRGDIYELRHFLSWMSEQDYQHKIFIAGNHDFLFQDYPEEIAELLKGYPKLTYLSDSSVSAMGLNIYGSPWQPWFHSWAFNLQRDGEEIEQKWQAIPVDTDILVTHGPPHSIGDRTQRGELAGCQKLYERLHQLKRLKLHVCGHIHEGYGTQYLDDLCLVNASVCNLQYAPINPPINLDLSND